MIKINKNLDRFLNATEFKQSPKKRTVETVKKKGVFFKGKKIAKNSEDMFTKMMGGK